MERAKQDFINAGSSRFIRLAGFPRDALRLRKSLDIRSFLSLFDPSLLPPVHPRCKFDSGQVYASQPAKESRAARYWRRNSRFKV